MQAHKIYRDARYEIAFCQFNSLCEPGNYILNWSETRFKGICSPP